MVGVPPGSYTVYFSECELAFCGTEWWDDAESQGSASPVIAVLGQVTASIDATLSEQDYCGVRPDPPEHCSGGLNLLVPTQFSTIQAAIDAAIDGDTVLVAPGTYVEQIRFWGKAIAVESSGGPDVTTIDAGGAVGANDGSAVRFWDAEGRDSVFAGSRSQEETALQAPVSTFSSPGQPSKGIALRATLHVMVPDYSFCRARRWSPTT